jgi:bleomycin hydrolase
VRRKKLRQKGTATIQTHKRERPQNASKKFYIFTKIELDKMRYLPSVFLLIAAGLLPAQSIKPSEKATFSLNPSVDLEASPVQNQHQSSTCWSFSSLAFFESELLRMKKPVVNLSEMFVVRHVYQAKAEKFVRLHGNANFGPGGAFHDPLFVLRTYGLMPESAYPGNAYGEETIKHNELDAVTRSLVDAVVKNPNQRLSTAWRTAFSGVLDAYLGPLPETVEWQGKKQSPQSFASSLGLKAEDYVDLTSFTHHPFYRSFPIEIPDNWSWESAYNVPLDALIECLNNALKNGYSVAWGADVSDPGFNHKMGLAIKPAAGFSGLSREEKEALFLSPQDQANITQQVRQEAFDRYEVTDDHGMLITGMFTDPKGTVYYKVKNSWGDKSNDCGGYFFASEAFVRLHTINLMMHKDALSSEVKKQWQGKK